MNRTLQQLKESVDRLIEQQGADASCAAYIFTKNDVYVENDDCEQLYFDEEITNKVLNDYDDLVEALKEVHRKVDYIGGYIGESVK